MTRVVLDARCIPPIWGIQSISYLRCMTIDKDLNAHEPEVIVELMDSTHPSTAGVPVKENPDREKIRLYIS